jgi:hypothetical protein
MQRLGLPKKISDKYTNLTPIYLEQEMKWESQIFLI